MSDNCYKYTQKLERWLELSEPERGLLGDHAKHCPNCSKALASMHPVIKALDRSAEAYHQIKYTGPIPRQPEKLVFFTWRRYLPKAGWATALSATICLLAWFGLKPPPSQDVASRPSIMRSLYIPRISSRGLDTSTIPMSPGALISRLPKPQIPVGSSLRYRIKNPKTLNHPKATRRKVSACAYGLTRELMANNKQHSKKSKEKSA